LATDEIKYLSYEEAVLIHIRLMNALGEARFGIDFRELLDSALARPHNAAIYENADIIRQAASLCFGLIKNHPWRGGNKRTATTLMRRFLEINGFGKNWTIAEQIELALAVEDNRWKVDEIESWLRQKIRYND
jgi:death-on-curing protein